MQKRPFRFGLINEQMPTPEGWLDRARQAESLGYSTFLLRDHFVTEPFGDQFAPLVALTAAATVTTSLHVGTMVLDNDYRHPVMLAKEVATLSYLSGGRFELGLGAGWLQAEYEAAGLTYDSNGVRIDRLSEALPIVQGLCANDTVTYTGNHYQISNMTNYPPLPAAWRPRLLIGAGKRRMLRLAGRYADSVGILTTSVATGVARSAASERLATAVAEKIGWIREGAADRFDQIELSMLPTIIITEDREAAIANLIARQQWTEVTNADVAAMPAILIGTVEEIAATLQQRREQYGFSYLVLPDRQLVACAPLVALLAGQ